MRCTTPAACYARRYQRRLFGLFISCVAAIGRLRRSNIEMWQFYEDDD